MAGYTHFENLGEARERPLLSTTFVPGAFDLWFPFIELEKPCSIGNALRRFVQGCMTEEDQAVFYTFFHEYLHLIQSALYFVCQLPIMFTHNTIYDIRVTSISRKAKGETRLLPICYSQETKDIYSIFNEEYSAIGNYREPFSVVNILEGSARLLEEKFRGHEVESGHWRYSAIREVNNLILSDRRLSDRALLDLCDVSLRRKNPPKTFIGLLMAIKRLGMTCNEDTYINFTQLADKIGLDALPSLANFVVENSLRIFNSPLYAQYCRQVESLYSQLPAIFGGGRVLSLIYDELSHDRGKGLPVCLLKWIYKCGSPVIISSDGRMEVLDVNIGTASPLDQNILGIKSVVESIIKQDSKGCMMRGACDAANSVGGCLPVDDDCSLRPWMKQPVKGMVCPFVAIWKAFGLEGLTP